MISLWSARCILEPDRVMRARCTLGECRRHPSPLGVPRALGDERPAARSAKVLAFPLSGRRQHVPGKQ